MVWVRARVGHLRRRAHFGTRSPQECRWSSGNVPCRRTDASQVVFPVFLCIAAAVLIAQPAQIDGPLCSVRCIESADGRVVGLSVHTPEGDERARVLLSPEQALTAQATVDAADPSTLRLSDFRGLAGVDLGDTSLVVRLPDDEPFPFLRLDVEVRSFDVAAWTEGQGEAPFHLLALPLAGAEVFHQRGWPIPTPRVDTYPLLLAEDGGRTVASATSRDWTYAPPIGAYPVPVAGLWNPSTGRYVAYDFHESRLREHTGDDVATAYCWKHGDAGEFVALVLPYPTPYNALIYPVGGERWSVAFHLIHADGIRSDDDPNLFVMERAWSRYLDSLPDAASVMDLSWYPDRLRLPEFGREEPGRLVAVAPEGAVWEEPGAVSPSGVGHTTRLRHFYAEASAEARSRFEGDLQYLLDHTVWSEAEGEPACFWEKPIEGEMTRRFGPGVGTIHTVQGWGVAQAILECYLGTGRMRAELLPYLDGALRFTGQILYTRNDYPDVPDAQFAWGAAPVAHYCLSYYYAFRDDPERQELARLALKLARTMTYRYLAIWQSDSAAWDELDSTWFMEPNSGLPWLGAACANEVWVVPCALAEVYAATGDPVLKQCLSGMLERWPVLARADYKPSIRSYATEWSERYGLYPGASQAPGTRAEYGGVWGEFEKLSWPVGGADLRVLAGEGGALCFSAKGQAVTISEVRAGRDGCSFRLVPNDAVSEQPLDEELDIVVTLQFVDLQEAACFVEAGGEAVELGPDRVERHAFAPDTVTVRGVRPGDLVRVGALDDDAAVLPCAMSKPRTRSAVSAGPMPRGFYPVDLAARCDTSLPRDWDDTTTYAGLHGGVRWIYGVPFVLIDPTQNEGRCALSSGQARADEVTTRSFALVAGAGEGATLVVHADDGSMAERAVHPSAVAIAGWPPPYGWRVHMVALEAEAGITAVEPRECLLLAMTGADEGLKSLARTDAELARALEAARAAAATRERIAALKPLLERFSGCLAALPTPDGTGETRLQRVLAPLGLDGHIRMLTPSEAADSGVLSARRFSAIAYTGGETFYETVRAPGDGIAALQRYLAEGGTLLVIPAQPLPFCYNEEKASVGAARELGLPITVAWEAPEAEADLEWVVAAGQTVFPDLPTTFEWDATTDPRFRPILDPGSPDVRYTPLITLRDRRNGESLGDGAALLEFIGGPLDGGRALYVWSSLQAYPAIAAQILEGALRWALSSEAPPPAWVSLPHTGEPPTLDGAPDEAVWGATSLPIAWRAYSEAGAQSPTVAHGAWDSEYLYLAFECADTDIWATKSESDTDLWTEEVVEAFVDPDGDGHDYLEFEVNPLGATVDLLIPFAVEGNAGDWRQNVEWDAPGWRSAVSVRGTTDDRGDVDEGWSAEWAIPWESLGIDGPHVGREFRLGLFRCEVSAAGEEEFLSWSPTPMFHSPAHFGVATLAPDPLADDFESTPEDAATLPGWDAEQGQWRVAGGVLVGENSGGDGWRAIGLRHLLPPGDCLVSFRFRLDSVGSDWRDGLWVGLRSSEEEDYTLVFSGRSLALHRTVGGASTNDETALATAPHRPDGDWHAVTVRLEGARVRVTLDGQPALDMTDPLPEELRPAGPDLVFSARRWSGGTGATRVEIDDLRIEAP